MTPNSDLSSPGGSATAGTVRPRRAPPPPPVPASPFAMISPFAQATTFSPLDRANSAESSLSEKGSSEQKRPTVRFADPPPDTTRSYNHTNSGFTELALARSGEAPAAAAAPGHNRTRSDNSGRDNSFSGGRPGAQRSISRNKSLSKQERAASANLDVLDLPPLPLPADAVGPSEELGSPLVSPMASRQPSRQMSLMGQMSSGFR